MLTKENVLDALRLVIDPELGINLVDLGLIYDVMIDEQNIYVKMTLTTPGCPLHESMSAAVEHRLHQLDATKKVFVQLVWQPQWTPASMSENARRQLGWAA